MTEPQTMDIGRKHSRAEEKTYEEKVEIFIQEILKDGNGTRAAKVAGWSENRARQTACELLKKPEIAARIKQVDQLEKKMLTDAPESIESMLENDIPKALRLMASQATDSDSAKKFLDVAIKFTNRKEELLGDYAEYSTGEIIRELDSLVAETQSLKERVMEAIRTGEMSE